jgi:hypothetical protein
MKKKAKEKEKPGAKKLVERAGIALKNGFYLETAWILSSLFERKIKRILLSSGERPSAGFSLEQSIKRLKFLLLTGKTPALNSYFEVRLIDGIRSWKNLRNLVLKDMLEVHVSDDRMERLAKDGVKLYHEFGKAYKKFKGEQILKKVLSQESTNEDTRENPE